MKRLLTGGGMSLVLFELADGAVLQSTGSSPGTELLYVISGGGSVEVGGDKSPLAAESLVYVPRGTPYVFKAVLDKNDKNDKNDKVVVAQIWATSPPRR